MAQECVEAPLQGTNQLTGWCTRGIAVWRHPASSREASSLSYAACAEDSREGKQARRGNSEKICQSKKNKKGETGRGSDHTMPTRSDGCFPVTTQRGPVAGLLPTGTSRRNACQPFTRIWDTEPEEVNGFSSHRVIVSSFGPHISVEPVPHKPRSPHQGWMETQCLVVLAPSIPRMSDKGAQNTTVPLFGRNWRPTNAPLQPQHRDSLFTLNTERKWKLQKREVPGWGGGYRTAQSGRDPSAPPCEITIFADWIFLWRTCTGRGRTPPARTAPAAAAPLGCGRSNGGYSPTPPCRPGTSGCWSGSRSACRRPRPWGRTTACKDKTKSASVPPGEGAVHSRSAHPEVGKAGGLAGTMSWRRRLWEEDRREGGACATLPRSPRMRAPTLRRQEAVIAATRPWTKTPVLVLLAGFERLGRDAEARCG